MSTRSITKAAGVALLTISAAGACAIDGQDSPVASGGPRTVAVAPRVVMDGLVALGARADRVVVDEVLFHAPVVTLRDGDRVLDDVLASDPDHEGPLFFRYDVSSSDGFGDVLGGERRWVFDDDGADLVVGFEPFSLGDGGDVALERLESDTGVDLDDLVAHTAVVHGFVLSKAATGGVAGGFSEGDPDGNPAHPTGSATGSGGKNADGDPDGNPAHPAGGGGKVAATDGDPDGNPAHPAGSGGKVAASDGDPDGNPATGTEGKDSGRHLDRHLAHGLAAQDAVSAHSPGSYTATPFFLVLDDTFALRVPVDSLLAGTVGAGQVMPIDLHVQLDRLLTDDLVEKLDEEAGDDVQGAIVVRVPGASRALGIEVQAHGVAHVREQVSSGGIRVVGDHR